MIQAGITKNNNDFRHCDSGNEFVHVDMNKYTLDLSLKQKFNSNQELYHASENNITKLEKIMNNFTINC